MKRKTFDIIFIIMAVVGTGITVGIVYVIIHFLAKCW
jgi:hypothetical protein